MMQTWMINLETDPETGDCILPFPEGVLETLGAQPGDRICFIDQGDGTWKIEMVKPPTADEISRTFATHEDYLFNGLSENVDEMRKHLRGMRDAYDQLDRLFDEVAADADDLREQNEELRDRLKPIQDAFQAGDTVEGMVYGSEKAIELVRAKFRSHGQLAHQVNAFHALAGKARDVLEPRFGFSDDRDGAVYTITKDLVTLSDRLK